MAKRNKSAKKKASKKSTKKKPVEETTVSEEKVEEEVNPVTNEEVEAVAETEENITPVVAEDTTTDVETATEVKEVKEEVVEEKEVKEEIVEEKEVKEEIVEEKEVKEETPIDGLHDVESLVKRMHKLGITEVHQGMRIEEIKELYFVHKARIDQEEIDRKSTKALEERIAKNTNCKHPHSVNGSYVVPESVDQIASADCLAIRSRGGAFVVVFKTGQKVRYDADTGKKKG